ncbi:FAD:protein FMN transferase [Pseudarthrobacter sp. PS3-L1]|uniref:FAD:protein FMN transferase n=1 Tax=Pseudarthrobacter sp. PS3-L1 TaxID=3046207 RepID=UPI0024BB82A1|nr:FAD:protein FMN transferase [Pseudarthrobacter sp. PS3-L1]MDJ0321553.1 FAD:protein FMN transferase [Pseudarthrobacter sp. PS3-L1]
MPYLDWADFSFAGIGTSWEISTPQPLPHALQEQVLECVENFDAAWSRFRPDSQVTTMSTRPGTYSFPPEAAALGVLYRTLYRISEGAMTPLIGASLEQLGYDAGYSLQPAGPPMAPPAWDDALSWEGSTLTTSRTVTLDVGAAGKGLLVDLVGELLRDAGQADFLIDASGDLLAAGTGPATIGLEHPYNPRQAIGTVPLHKGALCASASNRRVWGDGFHHVLDGSTGAPVRTVVAAWALAPTAMLADALATALFLVPAAALEAEFDFTWVTVLADGTAIRSPGFEGILFT